MNYLIYVIKKLNILNKKLKKNYNNLLMLKLSKNQNKIYMIKYYNIMIKIVLDHHLYQLLLLVGNMINLQKIQIRNQENGLLEV